MLSAPVVVDEMWFDFNGVPLKWHYPIGVLYDLLATQSDLPWPLTVHFQEFPSSSLLRCATEDIARSHVTNTLKEANFIKHGDATKFNSLSVLESDAIWDGIRNNDFDLFWGSNKLLAASINTMKNIPIRVIQDNFPFIQDLVLPKDENGNERTLASVVSQLLPQLALPPTSSQQVDLLPSPQGIQTPNTTSATTSSTQPKRQFVVLLQGIEPPLESTVVWLYDRFSYPDNFLYLVVHTK